VRILITRLSKGLSCEMNQILPLTINFIVFYNCDSKEQREDLRAGPRDSERNALAGPVAALSSTDSLQINPASGQIPFQISAQKLETTIRAGG
jgi:hypothetical protein